VAGSALTCFGVDGSDSRVYYLASSNNHVIELAWAGDHWVDTDLTKAAPVPVAGSALACFGVAGSASRVYYLDSDSYLNELAWADTWVHGWL
jgi:hypothetical protein